MRACMDENGMSFDEESVEELTRALYQDAASSHQPGITYSSLKSQMMTLAVARRPLSQLGKPFRPSRGSAAR